VSAQHCPSSSASRRRPRCIRDFIPDSEIPSRRAASALRQPVELDELDGTPLFGGEPGEQRA
jgi:hypothetical protein